MKYHVRAHFIDSLNIITIGHNEFSSTGRADGNNHSCKCTLGYLFLSYIIYRRHLEILSTEIILHTVLTIHTYLNIIMHLYRVCEMKVLCIFFACTLDSYKIIRNFFFSHLNNILLNNCIFIWAV